VLLLAQVTIENVLTADPTTPAISAPITAWFRKFGMAIANHCAMLGRDRYPRKPMPNPRNQKAKIASLLDNPLSPTSSVYGNFRRFPFVARFFHVLDVSVR
jgi:hypothetical protein